MSARRRVLAIKGYALFMALGTVRLLTNDVRTLEDYIVGPILFVVTLVLYVKTRHFAEEYGADG